MTEHKFMDEEIIRALECCLLSNSHQEEECDKCPLYETPLTICQNLMAYYALDLINRQRKEIEYLQSRLAIAVNDALNHTVERIRESTIRFVAVNEFAEYLEKYYRHIDKTAGALIEYTIDQKVKEFLEGG